MSSFGRGWFEGTGSSTVTAEPRRASLVRSRVWSLLQGRGEGRRRSHRHVGHGRGCRQTHTHGPAYAAGVPKTFPGRQVQARSGRSHEPDRRCQNACAFQRRSEGVPGARHSAWRSCTRCSLTAGADPAANRCCTPGWSTPPTFSPSGPPYGPSARGQPRPVSSRASRPEIRTSVRSKGVPRRTESAAWV